jgi:HTH-type transcriptional regulator/antitoxin HigA
MTAEYIELLKRFPPRPLKTEEDVSATQVVINSLIDQGTLTEDERDYLNVLGVLVYEYQELYGAPELRSRSVATSVITGELQE